MILRLLRMDNTTCLRRLKNLIKCESVYYNVQILDKIENVQMSDNTIE
jgi:hypothetical protein